VNIVLDSIYIVKKDSNELIFFGQLSDQSIEDLETVLGQIIMKASTQSAGSRKLIALKQGKFLYGVYDQYYMIFALSKGTAKDIADRILRKLGPLFQKKFGALVSSYAGDNNAFIGFTDDIKSALSSSSPNPAARPMKPVPKIKAPKPVEKQSIKKQSVGSKPEVAVSESKPAEPSSKIPLSQRRGMIQIAKSKVVVDQYNAEKPLIKAQKREAYPDGIPEYARDEVLFNESFDVQKNFECELVNYSVSVIKITLNISLTHIYNIEIDFSEYPKKPKLIMGEGLSKEIDSNYEQFSYILKYWDPKIPPHITEIVYEMEKIFTRLKSQGKLSATQNMPDYVLPELKPLDGDIAWNPNYKPKDIVPPKYDGTEITDKYTINTKSRPQARQAPQPQQGQQPVPRPVPRPQQGQQPVPRPVPKPVAASNGGPNPQPSSAPTPTKKLSPKELKKLEKENKKKQKKEKKKK
jgi:hypothetical protein